MSRRAGAGNQPSPAERPQSAWSSRKAPRLARSAPTRGCDPFARNRHSRERRGMSGKGRVTEGSHGLSVTRTLTTVYPFRYDDDTIVYTKSVKTSTPGPQVDGGERCPMACDRSSVVRSKGRKASLPQTSSSPCVRRAGRGWLSDGNSTLPRPLPHREGRCSSSSDCLLQERKAKEPPGGEVLVVKFLSGRQATPDPSQPSPAP